MTELLSLTNELIRRKSITPDDAGCQAFLRDYLQPAGFQITHLDYAETKNLLATHGSGQPFFVFAGHTDVVPPGPITDWNTDPFVPTEKNGVLYGRGAADMKAAVAAMTTSVKQFVQQNPTHPGTIALVITSDEEGPATNGTVKVIEYLQQQQLIPDFVVVGEASSNEILGDAIKIGRRGSMSGIITIHGKQGHIAYPEKALNPIHCAFSPLQQIAQTLWDQGDTHFPPTSLQFYDIQAGVGASNVIPGILTAKFNIRYAPINDAKEIERKIAALLAAAKVQFTLTCNVSSMPYFSGERELAAICKKAIKKVCNLDTAYNTTGGTSDGRHFAPLGSQVVEVGAVNKSIHKIDEHIALADLEKLEQIYTEIIHSIYFADK